jgi:hypothetical protein
LKTRALKIVAAAKSLSLLLLLTLPALAQARFGYIVSKCTAAITEHTGSGGATVISGAISGRKVDWQPGATVCSLNPRNPLRADTGFPDDFGTRKVIDLMCHHRIRTRRAFDNNSQDDCCNASDSNITLNPCGIVPVARDVSQPAVFLSTATARGPPRPSNQSFCPFDNALDRPALQFCTAPLLPEFPFHNLTLAHNPPRLFIQTGCVNRAGLALAASVFHQTQPNR